MPTLNVTSTITLSGLSRAGGEHKLRIDRLATGELVYTVLGANGKSHASVILDLAPLKEMADWHAENAE